jgi:predicted lipoprotein with Yx(FWY)xxD motif
MRLVLPLSLLVMVAAFAPAAEASTVAVSQSRYGDVLVNGKGRILYLFTKERTARSRCYGDCARAWPPFFTSGKSAAAEGVDASLVGSTKRRGGKRQVTYGGHPLYYYVTDRKPGVITCQNVFEFGGRWLVIDPGGRPER